MGRWECGGWGGEGVLSRWECGKTLSSVSMQQSFHILYSDKGEGTCVGRPPSV